MKLLTQCILTKNSLNNIIFIPNERNVSIHKILFQPPSISVLIGGILQPLWRRRGEEYWKGWLLCPIIHKIPILAEQALIEIKYPRNIFTTFLLTAKKSVKLQCTSLWWKHLLLRRKQCVISEFYGNFTSSLMFYNNLNILY